MRRLIKFLSTVKTEIIIALFAVACTLLALKFLSADYFGKIANILQWITTIIALIAWWVYYRQLINKETPRMLEGDTILAIAASGNISKEDMLKDIEKFMDNENKNNKENNSGLIIQIDNNPERITKNATINLYRYGQESNMYIVSSDGAKLSTEGVEMNTYINEYKKCLQYVADNCGNEIHVFFSGPSFLEAFIMPYFQNKKPVVAYHSVSMEGKKNGYVRVGRIEK